MKPVTKDIIQVLIVDDHVVVRKGIISLLATEADIAVAGEAANGQEAEAEARKLNPDVILMDLVMPVVDGVEAIRRIRSLNSEACIIVLTSFGSDDKIFPAIEAGAVGYLLKDASPEELVRAIREAAAGQSTLDPSVARRLLSEYVRNGDDESPGESLTEREIQVLQKVARGMRNDQISACLFISEATVRTHVSNILAKLNLHNRTQAALYALKKGLASLDGDGDV